MSQHQEAKLAQNIPPYPESRRSKQGSMRASDCQEGQSEDQLPSATNNSALETAANATEPGYEHAKSTSTIEAELQLQDTSVSPDPVPSNSGSALNAQTPGQPSEAAPQAAEGGASAIKIATLASPCGISDGTKTFAGGAMRSATGERVYHHVKYITSPVGRACEGPLNTPQNGNEAAGVQCDVVEHATPLDALPSGLPKSAIAERDGNPASKLSDASLSPPPTENNGERGAVHCEQEHDNANVAATPEGSISPETPRSAPENDIKEATLRRNGEGPSASRLAALLSELQGLRCSPADQDSGDSDGPSCTCESTDSMPSPATSLSEHDELYFAFADMSNAIPATAGMVLIDGQSP